MSKVKSHWSERISFRLARTAVFIAFIVGSVLSAGQVYLDYREAGNELTKKVEDAQRVAKQAATRAVLLLDTGLAQEVALGFTEYDFVAEVRIFDDSGNEIAFVQRETRNLTPELGIANVLFDKMDFYSFALGLPENMSKGPGELRLVVDRAVGLEPFIARAITVFFSGLLRNFLLAMFLYFAFYSVITKPLRLIVDKISKIDPGRPGLQRLTLPAKHDDDEFGLLTRQINQSFDAAQVLLDHLRSTNQALTSSEEALRLRSWELEQEVERAKQTSFELLRTKERAEAANQAKSVFLANVSHELRTPLNAIIGFSSIMVNEMFGKVNNKKYREYMQHIFDSSRHLSDVLGEVLDLAKIEVGEMAIEEEPVDLKRMCKESVALVSAQAAKKMLKIDVNIEEEMPLILGDRLRLKQSVLNLLSNAVKFTSENGKPILLTCGSLDDGRPYIRVQDHGIGIVESEQQLIFSPFVRSATALSRSHEGTGLGLSLVKAFVDVHQGEVMLESVPGKGSKFTMTFPTSRLERRASAKNETVGAILH